MVLLVKIGNYLKDPTLFLLKLCEYPSFEEDLALHFNNLEIHSYRDVLYMCDSCGPSRPLGPIICTSLNLHYVGKLSCKSELFWLSGSRGDIFP
jgi:hypothetical protein